MSEADDDRAVREWFKLFGETKKTAKRFEAAPMDKGRPATVTPSEYQIWAEVNPRKRVIQRAKPSERTP